jgi:hypothetical protein
MCAPTYHHELQFYGWHRRGRGGAGDAESSARLGRKGAARAVMVDGHSFVTRPVVELSSAVSPLSTRCWRVRARILDPADHVENIWPRV